MTARRTRGDAADRTAQGIDRTLRNVETGRFERSLSALTAAGVWLPVALGPVGGMGLPGAILRREK